MIIKLLLINISLVLVSVIANDYIEYESFLDIYLLVINISAIIITMVGLWLAVVYNDFVKLITEANTYDNIEECKNARKFIASIFYLSLVILLSICTIVITKINSKLYEIYPINLILNYSLFLSLYMLLKSLYRVLSPFATMLWKLEKKENKTKKYLERHGNNKGGG